MKVDVEKGQESVKTCSEPVGWGGARRRGGETRRAQPDFRRIGVPRGGVRGAWSSRGPSGASRTVLLRRALGVGKRYPRRCSGKRRAALTPTTRRGRWPPY